MTARRTSKPIGLRRTSAERAIPQRAVELGRLKDQLLQPLLRETGNPVLQAKYRWAAEEAAALAFVTPWPQLFFPVLLAEKAAGARTWVRRQAEIRERFEGSAPDKPETG